MLMKELGECRMQDMKITRGWCTAGSQLLSEMCKQVSLLWKWNAFSNVSDSPLPTQHHSAELRRVQKSINTTHMRPCMPCCLAHPAPAPRRVSQANPAQGAATFKCLPSVREAAQKRLPRAQTSHSVPMGRCASEAQPSQIAAAHSHSYFLHFPESEGKQLPPGATGSVTGSHLLLPKHKEAVNVQQLRRDSPELNALPQSCLSDTRDRIKHQQLCSGVPPK